MTNHRVEGANLSTLAISRSLKSLRDFLRINIYYLEFYSIFRHGCCVPGLWHKKKYVLMDCYHICAILKIAGEKGYFLQKN